MNPLERADLHAAIETRYPDNTTAYITPQLLREGLHDLVDSVFVKATDVTADTSSALFLSDTEAILSPANQARLPAGKLYWLVKVATPPALPTGQRTTVPVTGLVADGVLNADQEFLNGTDNANALLTVQQLLTSGAFHQQPAYELQVTAGTGIIGASNTKYLLGFRDFIFDLGGNTFIPIYAGSDNFFQATVYRPEALQNNGATYVGTKAYFTAPLIDTVQPGATQVVVKAASRALLDPQTYYVGARIAPYSKEKVLGSNAYPPGTIHNEMPRTITAINYATGVIAFTPALEYEHRDDWPENAQTAGGGSGRGRLLPLDDPRNPYKDYAEFRNGKMFASSVKAPGAMAYVANTVVYRNINMNRGGTPTESLTGTLYEDCDVEDEIEGDKLNGWVRFLRTIVRGFLSNFGGSRSMDYKDGYIGASAQVACSVVSFSGTECWAKPFYTDSGTRLHAADPAVASYVGFHQTNTFTIEALKLGATNDTDAYLDCALYEEYTVLAVNAGRIECDWDGSDNRDQLLFWRGATIGTPIYTVDGAKGGRITALEFVSERHLNGQVITTDGTSGTFYVTIAGVTPAVGDVYVFSNVLNVIDNGGHTILTPQHKARLWGFDNLRWKGNQGGTPNAPGPLTLTKADLLFKNNGPVAYFRLGGKPNRVTLTAPTAAPAGARLLAVTTNKAQSVGVELVKFDLATTGTRFASAASASAGISATTAASAGLNQYRPDGFGRFGFTMALVFDGVAYADIPDDLTLTIDTDYF